MRGATQVTVNPLRPGYNDRDLADDISKLSYSIKIVVNCFKFDDIWFKGHIKNKQEIVYIKAWHRTGDKLSSEPTAMQFSETYMTTRHG